MLLSQNASLIRPLNLYLMVYISLVFGTLQALPDVLDEPCIFEITLRNFRPILSWKLKDHSIVPTHYTLQYAIMSEPEDIINVKNCTNITRSSCDLTDAWVNMSETYTPIVVGMQGNRTLVNCEGSLFPLMDMSLEPPNFKIASFTDHMNVTVEFPPVLPKIMYGEGLWFHLSPVIEEESGNIVKKHKPKINSNITGNFIYVINELIPNTNYCISVYFEPFNPGTIKRSPVKCTLLQLEQESESSESAKIGGLITLFLIAAVIISTIVTLKRIGYICLRNEFPKVLKFKDFSAWIFPELPPLEGVSVLEVIHINRKKKVWNYNYDESESEDEAATRTSAGGYTKHGLTGRLLCPASTSSATLEACSNPDPEETDLPEPEVKSESLMAPGPDSECTYSAYKRRETELTDLFSEDSSSTKESGDKTIFNVNLNSVFMRVLDDDSEVPPVLSLPEETVDLEDPEEMETSLLVASGEGSQPSFPSSSVECLSSEDTPSEKSDTSKADVNIADGYLMR
ncbi:interferon alpha/beta receptor 2 isoform X3 [Rousettus aegyptiacus]|uniref:Interferon alpha/beta receptor 2 n=1 Tax=Rousettus aegyptiacus TaxID=9407 RepID=A0A7J8HR71_ROUAE|nr:interferon alpha/beta receptor 2 isoform X3 [Rousettus aegyptiacus]KAF6474405.1 interferon alpha and beta receptor subunit 2 [Rousettus aegyptiacus]